MKIALLILHSEPSRGGAERYTVDLAAALAGRGHEVSLLSSSFGDAITGVKNVELSAKGATRLAKYGHFLDSIDRHLAENQYDVVHAMLPVRQCGLYHPHAGLAIEAVRIGHEKRPGKLDRLLSKLGNQLNRKRQKFAEVEQHLLTGSSSPIVVCLSRQMESIVRHWYPEFQQQKVVILFNAVDLKKFDPAGNGTARNSVRSRFGISGEQIVALMIAQDFERKGLREAILALSKINNPSLMLLVVGKQDSTHYKQLAQSAGVAAQVCFAGVTNDPVSFYKAADFFVLPTRHDPCSLVVLEALAMGLPVISTKQNGACEIMIDAAHGFVLADPSDVNALAQAMTNLINLAVRARMSSACRELRTSLSYSTHIENLERIYSQVNSYKNRAGG